MGASASPLLCRPVAGIPAAASAIPNAAAVELNTGYSLSGNFGSYSSATPSPVRFTFGPNFYETLKTTSPTPGRKALPAKGHPTHETTEHKKELEIASASSYEVQKLKNIRVQTETAFYQFAYVLQELNI